MTDTPIETDTLVEKSTKVLEGNFLKIFTLKKKKKCFFKDPKEEKPNKPERDQWSKDIEFLLASIGYCVGVGNVWRYFFFLLEQNFGIFNPILQKGRVQKISGGKFKIFFKIVRWDRSYRNFALLVK